MSTPALTAAYVTDKHLAEIWEGARSVHGLFVAPCAVLTVLPGRRMLQLTQRYTLPEDVVAAHPVFAEACRPKTNHTMQRPARQVQTMPPAPQADPADSLRNAGDILMHILTTKDPCDIPGCEDWRAELEAQMRELPPDCSKCDRNSLVGRFVRRLTPVVAAHLRTL